MLLKMSPTTLEIQSLIKYEFVIEPFEELSLVLQTASSIVNTTNSYHLKRKHEVQEFLVFPTRKIPEVIKGANL